MRAISSLVQNAVGLNAVYAGCCATYFDVTFELDPGEADFQIEEVFVFGTSTVQIQILEAGGLPYSTPYTSTVNIGLSPYFILTQGNQFTLRFRFCSGWSQANRVFGEWNSSMPGSLVGCAELETKSRSVHFKLCVHHWIWACGQAQG